jgi:hypothetical protein
LKGKVIGLVLSLVAVLLAAYEFVAIATPLPTISREVQGLPGGARIGIGIALGVVLIAFAAWVIRHLGWEHRSEM